MLLILLSAVLNEATHSQMSALCCLSPSCTLPIICAQYSCRVGIFLKEASPRISRLLTFPFLPCDLCFGGKSSRSEAATLHLKRYGFHSSYKHSRFNSLIFPDAVWPYRHHKIIPNHRNLMKFTYNDMLI